MTSNAAYENRKQLNIYSEADTKVWFEMFKHGVLPASEAVEQGVAADSQ